MYEPETAALVEEKQRNDTQQVAQLVRSGASAFKRVYLDGDMHKSYRRLLDSAPSHVSFNVAEVSRPEALKGAPLEMPIQ